ncbi:patatin-like phospholipase family protein [Bacillus taeanensis]|uniref:PNPLA domain-containing protein n=1 Tax=Bacillus taeanensis TaxID=273032 RepID=A0A366Y2H3_9BACI|nr:patatin-like phospholipase family protein [Bacillus taeanensis]RBW70594.1 hypothetical protein DS031_06155 [Bacillus taeanensis]
MLVDGVFSGGGVKAIALIGALEVVEKQGITFKRAAGTSGGAIVGSLLMAGYTSSELKKILFQTNLTEFLDEPKSIIPFPFIKWLRLYWKLGMYKGDRLEEWLETLLKKKGIYTFQDLPAGSLKIIASDITTGRLIVLPDDLQNYGVNPGTFSVATAVRMSSGLPYFFEPVPLYNKKAQKSLIVDGGILSNFPLWVFQRKNSPSKRPIIGLQLSSKQHKIQARKIKNAFDLYYALFATMREAHDARYISKHDAKSIIFIPIEKVMTTSFEINKNSIDMLINIGKLRAEKFFKERWMH